MNVEFCDCEVYRDDLMVEGKPRCTGCGKRSDELEMLRVEIGELTKHLESLQNRFAQCTAESEARREDAIRYRSQLRTIADIARAWLSWNTNSAAYGKVNEIYFHAIDRAEPEQPESTKDTK